MLVTSKHSSNGWSKALGGHRQRKNSTLFSFLLGISHKVFFPFEIQLVTYKFLIWISTSFGPTKATLPMLKSMHCTAWRWTGSRKEACRLYYNKEHEVTAFYHDTYIVSLYTARTISAYCFPLRAMAKLKQSQFLRKGASLLCSRTTWITAKRKIYQILYRILRMTPYTSTSNQFTFITEIVSPSMISIQLEGEILNSSRRQVPGALRTN